MLRAGLISQVGSFLTHDSTAVLQRTHMLCGPHCPHGYLGPARRLLLWSGSSHSAVARRSIITALGHSTFGSGHAARGQASPCSPGLPLKGRNVLYLCCFSCLALEPTRDHGWPRRMDAVDRNAWDWLRHTSRLWVPTARWLFLHLCFWLVLNTWKLLFVQEAALPLPMPVSSHL